MPLEFISLSLNSCAMLYIFWQKVGDSVTRASFVITQNRRPRDPYSNPHKSQAVGFFTTLLTSFVAEGGGFEPPKAFTLLPFQGSALDRYANPLSLQRKRNTNRVFLFKYSTMECACHNIVFP